MTFWSLPRVLNNPVTVMVAPDAQIGFETDLLSNNLEFSVLIDNVERALQRRFEYLYLITSYLETLAQNYPGFTRLEILGQSYEGRDIYGLRISSGGFNKPAIFVDAGIHAREWIAPPTRLWRKTRTPNTLCYGVDPNRNFDFYWMLNGASSSQCSEIYAGPTPFSESETRALRDYLLANADTIKLYLTFHSYGQYLLYPWGYTSDLPDDNDELYALGVSVNNAIRSVAGTTYEIGTSTNVLYAAAGGSDDYAKGVSGIELSYTIELPGGGTSGFNPPASRILPIVQETWEGVKTRLWRKTRSSNLLCYGTDPNRNFDFYWMLVGASNDQCSEVFAGPRPFSESETRALRDYLLAHQNEIKLYLTYHSYGRYLLYPWGYTSDLPSNNDELYSLAVSVNNAIRNVSGTTYTIGTSTNALYAAAGGSDDYAKAVAGIELSYTIELPGGGTAGFNPPATRILPIVQESWEGVKAYHHYIETQFAN
ncbi:hypothetical protein NQ314_000801 [Rhamnusium bicolor]|uniref:Peptidase M14 domain-containing protein n=1 Tax=Rhamnusium bicolor TaxID=1586634 RepID=A0AAV8ZU69_9CUCU|nr:hypothetical protein NQ314_000801 [Rhamnusium bicolor]